MKRHTPLIMGNWKMNPATIGDAKDTFIAIRKGIIRKRLHCTVAIAPPYPYLSALEELSHSRRIELVAQDVFYEGKGTYTGEVSVKMLISVGVTSVIVGHSERRALGESNEGVAKRVAMTITSGLTAVACVGEKERDTHGEYFSYVEEQVRAIITAVPKNKLQHLVIAYEPIWAISSGDGKGKTATPADAEEMKLFIQKVIAATHGRKATDKVRILYGGSVNSKNATVLLEEGQVDGFLVGGASLKPAEFINVIQIASAHGKTN